MNQPDPLHGWIPLFLSRHHQQATIDWAYMGTERFTEPFCHDTLQKLARKPFNRLFRQQSGLALLTARAQCHRGLPLRGIVFHMSRCGSTLVSQWLTALDDSVVLAEPEPVDTLLQWPELDSNPSTIRALLSALGQARRTTDSQLFLKTDCWHMIHIDRLLTAFPNVPWVFLYRDPIEVLVSHQRMPGWQLVPGALRSHGFIPPDDVTCYPLGHGAWVLSLILQQAYCAIQRYPHGLLLNYTELPDALEQRLAQHFGIDITPSNRATLHAATLRHTKQQHTMFQSDIAEKRAAVSTEINQLTARWLDEPYQTLQSLHRSKST